MFILIVVYPQSTVIKRVKVFWTVYICVVDKTNYCTESQELEPAGCRDGGV